jgi:hypothetical protein
MGRGKDKRGGGRGGKQFSDPVALAASESEDEEEDEVAPRGVGKQQAPRGMPPSDSEEESDEGGAGGQSANAGMMPPNSSDEGSDSEGEAPQMTRKEREALEAQQPVEKSAKEARLAHSPTTRPGAHLF